jgi:quercetin dioxygenase-like cupin family protein
MNKNVRAHKESAVRTLETQMSIPTDTLAQFNLTDIIRAIRNDRRAPAREGRTTRMPTKGPGLRIGLILMQSGSKWEEHKTDFRITVQPIEGRIRFSLQRKCVELGANEVLVLEPREPHSVEALEDTAFLLTLY